MHRLLGCASASSALSCLVNHSTPTGEPCLPILCLRERHVGNCGHHIRLRRLQTPCIGEMSPDPLQFDRCRDVVHDDALLGHDRHRTLAKEPVCSRLNQRLDATGAVKWTVQPGGTTGRRPTRSRNSLRPSTFTASRDKCPTESSHLQTS